MTDKTATAIGIPRLKSLYSQTYSAELSKQLKLGNVHELPRLEKVMVSVGLGKAKDDKKILEVATNTLRKITGQQPVETLARKSIASFKLRQGSRIGLKVTLRGARMYEFVDRFVNIVMPRLRDFHGVSAEAFDKQGNYNIGLEDQSVFPELNFEDTATPHGLQVTFVINQSGSKEYSRALLEKLGVPFEKSQTRTFEEKQK